jgi:hypothetical protein
MKIIKGFFKMKVPKGFKIKGIISSGTHELHFNNKSFCYSCNNDSIFGGTRLKVGKIQSSMIELIVKMSKKSIIFEDRDDYIQIENVNNIIL